MKKVKQVVSDYTTIFDPSEDGGYTVTVPTLPGLVTEGDTLQEARAMARDAIKCYLESLAMDLVKIPTDDPNYKPGKLTVGKIVISPYKAEIHGPSKIHDSELVIKLWLMKHSLDILFDETSGKNSRIESLKNLLTVCDKHLRSLIEKEVARLSTPKKPAKKKLQS